METHSLCGTVPQPSGIMEAAPGDQRGAAIASSSMSAALLRNFHATRIVPREVPSDGNANYGVVSSITRRVVTVNP